MVSWNRVYRERAKYGKTPHYRASPERMAAALRKERENRKWLQTALERLDKGEEGFPAPIWTPVDDPAALIYERGEQIVTKPDRELAEELIKLTDEHIHYLGREIRKAIHQPENTKWWRGPKRPMKAKTRISRAIDATGVKKLRLKL